MEDMPTNRELLIIRAALDTYREDHPGAPKACLKVVDDYITRIDRVTD